MDLGEEERGRERRRRGRRGNCSPKVIRGRRLSFKRQGKQGLDLFGKEIKALISGVR